MIIRVPRELSIQTNYAQLLTKTVSASMDVQSEEAVLDTKTSPVLLKIRNRAFFDSIGLKSLETLMREDIQKGNEAALRAAGEYGREAAAMEGPRGMTVADIARRRFLNAPVPVMELTPIGEPEISWEGGGVTGEYHAGELLIRWDTGGIQKGYLPYSVEVAVAEWKSILNETNEEESP